MDRDPLHCRGSFFMQKSKYKGKYLKRKMKRFLAAFTVAPIAISSAAVAGPYINADIESKFYDGEYHMSQTGLHLGYKDAKGKLEYHIQGGPLLTEVDNPDDAGIEIDYSAKAGISYAVKDNVDIYGKVTAMFFNTDYYGKFDEVTTNVGVTYQF